MPRSIATQIHELSALSPQDLVAKFTAVCGEPPRSRRRAFLERRIAWRLQADVHGGLDATTTGALAQLIAHHDPLQREATHRVKPRIDGPGTRRVLPRVGTIISRAYKGKVHEVTVVADGFSYNGELFRSLSAVAKRITGAHWNGPLFFGLR